MSEDFSIIDLADLAAGQWGLVTTAQGRSLGLSTQRIAQLARNGTLERVRHGVYRATGAPSTPTEQLRAAWLAIEPRRTAADRLEEEQPAVVSHRSAAQLHGLGDLDADVMQFTVAHRKQSRLNDVQYRVATLDRNQWTLVDGLPTTSILRTIDSLAADRLDGGHLAGVVRDAVTTGRADMNGVIAVLRPHAHKYGATLGDGVGFLDRLLQEAGVSESTRTFSHHVAVTAPEAWQSTIAALGQNSVFQEAMARQLAPIREALDALNQNPALQAIATLNSSNTALQEAMARQLAPAREAIAALNQNPALQAIATLNSSNTALQEAMARQLAPAREAIAALNQNPALQAIATLNNSNTALQQSLATGTTSVDTGSDTDTDTGSNTDS